MKKIFAVIFFFFFVQNCFADSTAFNAEAFDAMMAEISAAQDELVVTSEAVVQYKEVVAQVASKTKELKGMERSAAKALKLYNRYKEASSVPYLKRTAFIRAKALVESAPREITRLNSEIASLSQKAKALKKALPPGVIRQGITTARQTIGTGAANRARDIRTAIGEGAKPLTDKVKTSATPVIVWFRNQGGTLKSVVGNTYTGARNLAVGGVAFTWRGFLGAIKGGTWLTSQGVLGGARGVGKLGGVALRGVGTGTRTLGAVYTNHYMLLFVAGYNLGKLGIYSSTSKWISSPPDVLLNGFEINPVTQEATINYYISVNADKNIRKWNTSAEIFEDTGANNSWTSKYTKLLQPAIEVASLNLTDIVTTNTDAGLSDGVTLKDAIEQIRIDMGNDMIKAKSAPANDLILHCRLMIYKSAPGKIDGFKKRDQSFEPVSVLLPSGNCIEGEGKSYSFSLKDKLFPMGDYEAIMFVYFHPAVIIASKDIIDGTYDHEGWFISNSWWPWADGQRTFSTYEKIWRHALENDEAAIDTIPPQLKSSINQNLEEFQEDVFSLTFKVSQSGLPSNPVYFSPTQGDAYVDISGIIKLKNYDIYDSKEGFTRPLTADDVVDGLKRVVKLSDSSSVDEFPLGEVYSHPELENYLWFFNISQGEYLLETEIIGYGEPIQMRFTIIADNFVGGKS